MSIQLLIDEILRRQADQRSDENARREGISRMDITLREYFQVQFDAMRSELGELAGTGKAILVETRKTNGRVIELERQHAQHDVKLRNLEREVFRGARKSVGVVTMRDVYLVLGTLGVTGAAVKWVPALLAIGRMAP
jgi:hypothetical protein